MSLELSRGKLLAFRILGLLLPLLLLGVAEVTTRYFASERDPYLHVDQPTTIFSQVEIKGKEYIQVTHPAAYAVRGTKFLVKKPRRTLRVFSFGGSANAGWPLPPSQSYTRALERALRAAFPRRRVEVVNLGAHAFASYRVRMIFDDVIRFDPDLVVIYSGNNDFLEKRSYLLESRLGQSLALLGRRSALVRVAARELSLLRESGNTIDGRGAAGHHDDAVFGWVRRMSLELRKNPAQFEAVKSHYAYSIEAMAARAHELGIPTFLLTVPVNLRDWIPNASHNGLEGPALTRWEGLYTGGRRALLENDASLAAERLESAIELEPLHAETYFWRARAFELLGQENRARSDYLTAKDLDYNPFRAISAFNRALREIADRYDSAHLVDAEGAFIEASAGIAPGFELFLDYVHPTPEGNEVLARLIFSEIIERGIFAAEPARRTFRKGRKSSYDIERDAFTQMLLLWILGLNRQEASMFAKAEAIVSTGLDAFLGKDPDTARRLMRFAEEVEDTISPHLALEERRLREIDVPQEEAEQIERRVATFYERYYDSGGRPWSVTP